MAYRVVVKKSVLRDLKGIDKKSARRLLDELERALAENPYRNKKLRAPFEGLRRHRVGDYRAIYIVQENPEKKVTILRISHRKDAYR